MTNILEASELSAAYGASPVLHRVAFAVPEQGITVLLGANGAGKTTALRAICGLVRRWGRLEFLGKDISGLATEEVVRLGIGHVPEGRGTLSELTVEENLRLGAYTRRDHSGVMDDIERVHEYFPKLKERAQQQAGTLSGGEQQMLAIGRALMLRPKLLLLDEPSFGLAPLIVDSIYQILERINRSDGISILLVEQNARRAMDLATTFYLLETGHIVLQGEPGEILENEAVRRAYLGY